jgi:DNA modification methylase
VNRLYYGDNLDVLRAHVPDGSVDLVYLDPPFNSNRGYNVIFNHHDTTVDAAQIQAFDDTWRWTPVTETQYTDYIAGELPNEVADALTAFRTLLGENDAMAYLVNMAPRLVELHRALKPTGSLYLHCDPTMSHYLKVLLDAIFGADRFRGEITWVRTTTHNDAKRWSPNADIILYYGKGQSVTWNPVHTEHSDAYVTSKYRFDDGDGRRYRLDNITSPNPRPNLTYEWKGHAPPPNGWRYSREKMTELDAAGLIWYPDSTDKRPQLKRYLDEQEGVVIGNVWTDIWPINSRASERLGYPTQKPLKLLERIITASSNPDDIVLDPFCGCGTTVDAAQKLGRQWIGIDITYLSIDLIEKRLQHTYGDSINDTYEVRGIPRDKAAALALFSRDPFEFERWAVALINAQPNQKQVGDRGIDGVARFPLGDPNQKGGGIGRILVSVKGGATVGPQFARDLLGTVETQRAEMGVLITNAPPTRGVMDAVDHGGTYKHPANGVVYPRVQVITVTDLLAGKRPNLPGTLNPYIQARKSVAQHDHPELFPATDRSTTDQS